MAIPPKPAEFHPELAPDGVEVKFCSFWQRRPLLDHGGKARMIVVHTNAARGEGSLDSASNWTERNTWPGAMYGNPPGDDYYTITHYQAGRGGEARKILPSNRRGIANSTGSSVEHENVLASPGYEDASWHALAIETADTGTDDDPTISDFTPAQAETVAKIIAYESIVHDFPIELPATWWGSGVCSHTDPFPYPYLTTVRGKPCPGDKKKATVRNVIIPRAIEIRTAWLAPPPPPIDVPEEDTMAKLYLARQDSNQYHYRRGDGNVATILRSREYLYLQELYKANSAPAYHNPLNGNPITKWDEIPVLPDTVLDLWVGYVDGSSRDDEG